MAAAPRAARSSISARDVREGRGNAAAYGSRVRVLYVGKLLPGSGATFDRNTNSNKPLQFVVGDEGVIEGFEVGVVGMRVVAGLITQGVPGVPWDPFAPLEDPRGPL